MREKREDAHTEATLSVVSGGEGAADGRLVVVWEGGALARDLPASGTLVIGRAPDCDVCIDHGSVSRRHAALHLGLRTQIEDLGSANGTSVRGLRLARGEPREIASGEIVELGGTQLIVTAPRVPSPASGASGGEGLVVGRAMRELYTTIDQVASSELCILLLGETGVGKDVVASRIHAVSARKGGPFVAINCAALSEALLESELFGHERGAFTGAHATKTGLFESASGGTVLLDEIGELAVGVQSKLLRALETREVVRVGGLKPRPFDVRFVSATSRGIEALVQSERFRSDLYYRVSGAVIRVPPLRERHDEIFPLAQRFVALVHEKTGRPLPRIGASARALLEGYHWPGNIRELRNVIERAALTCLGPEIRPEHLAFDALGPRSSPFQLSPSSASPGSATITAPPPPRESGAARLRPEVEALERRRIIEALEEFGGNQTRAAKALGISRRTLLTRLDDYGVPRPRK